jgi:phage shock protein A
VAEYDYGERITDLERQVKAIHDAMNVQGILQWRTERNLAELTQDIRDLRDVVAVLAHNQAATQTALNSLIATVDRFVRGQSGNGQEK